MPFRLFGADAYRSFKPDVSDGDGIVEDFVKELATGRGGQPKFSIIGLRNISTCRYYDQWL